MGKIQRSGSFRSAAYRTYQTPFRSFVQPSLMPFSSAARKAAVLIHVSCSIGWIGAVAAFLALAITGWKNTDLFVVRAAYIAMEYITWPVIVPLAFAALISGVLLSLGTPWGLLRHYWIVFKLLINIVSIGLLLLHTGVIHQVAHAAAAGSLYPNDLMGPRTQLVEVSIAALAVLLLATMLSIYKPRGLTSYGAQRSEK